MSELITAKINVSLIEKARLFKGQKGTYLDIVLIPTPNGEYGDFMIKQQTSKEERDVKMPILGNARIMRKRPEPPPRRQAEAAKPVAGDDPRESEDVPF